MFNLIQYKKMIRCIGRFLSFKFLAVSAFLSILLSGWVFYQDNYVAGYISDQYTSVEYPDKQVLQLDTLLGKTHFLILQNSTWDDVEACSWVLARGEKANIDDQWPVMFVEDSFDHSLQPVFRMFELIPDEPMGQLAVNWTVMNRRQAAIVGVLILVLGFKMMRCISCISMGSLVMLLIWHFMAFAACQQWIDISRDMIPIFMVSGFLAGAIHGRRLAGCIGFLGHRLSMISILYLIAPQLGATLGWPELVSRFVPVIIAMISPAAGIVLLSGFFLVPALQASGIAIYGILILEIIILHLFIKGRWIFPQANPSGRGQRV